MLVVSVSVAGLVTLAAMTQPALAPEAKHSLLQYVTGKYLLPSNCRVHFEWEEPQLVGETMTFTVKVSKSEIAAGNRRVDYLYSTACDSCVEKWLSSQKMCDFARVSKAINFNDSIFRK